MAGSIASFLVMSIAGRATTAELNVFQVLEMRSVIGFFMLLPLVYFSGGFAAMRTQRPLQHIGRNVAHYAGQFAWLYALTLIPLGELISIEFTTPIWTAILAVTFLGERLTRPRIAAIVLGLVGIVIIVRPGVDTVEPGHLVVLGARLRLRHLAGHGEVADAHRQRRAHHLLDADHPVGDRARPCPLFVAQPVAGAVAVDPADRLHRHVFAFLHGAGARLRRRDADLADRFPARAAVGADRLAALS